MVREETSEKRYKKFSSFDSQKRVAFALTLFPAHKQLEEKLFQS